MIEKDDLENQDPEQDSESRRQIVKRGQREAGDRSGRIARALLALRDHQVRQLEIDDELREAIERARAMQTHGARRREERRLAGILRNIELSGLEAQLAALDAKGNPDVRLFHAAESWRERLVSEGEPALAELTSGGTPDDQERWNRLITQARAERACGRPRGAGRQLFRAVIDLLKARETQTEP